MKRLGITIILSMLCINGINADFFAPRTIDKFNTVLNEHDLAVVYFNQYDSDESAVEFDQVEQMKAAFIKLSNQERYQQARVAFISVNLDRGSEIAKQFNIDDDEPSVLMIVKNGQPLQNRKGFLSGQAMKDFIETYLGSSISKIAPVIKTQRKVIRYTRPVRERRVVRYSYPEYYDDYDYYPSYYPYGGYYGRRYWGPGFGVGVGFGGRRGGVGFGFGW